MKQVEVYTDGACSGNPGPGGWGAVLRYRFNGKVYEKELSGGDASTTNNRMELTAFIEALRQLKEPCEVRLCSDSQYVINGLQKGWAKGWQRRGWKKADKSPALNPDLWAPLLEESEKHKITYHWLKGHAGHPEVEGTMGQVDDGIVLVESPEDVKALKLEDESHLAYVTQTTISADDSAMTIAALKERFPDILEPRRQDICYATQYRQAAVKALARTPVDVVLVIGSATSSNSNRLREVAEREGTRAYLVDTAEHVDLEWFRGVSRVGVTAGASAPESLVQEVVAFLKEHAAADEVVAMPRGEENVAFPLPKGLRAEDEFTY